jgi:hypothetical protein
MGGICGGFARSDAFLFVSALHTKKADSEALANPLQLIDCETLILSRLACSVNLCNVSVSFAFFENCFLYKRIFL